MIAVAGYNDVIRIYGITQRDGIDYNLAFIGTDLDLDGSGQVCGSEVSGNRLSVGRASVPGPVLPHLQTHDERHDGGPHRLGSMDPRGEVPGGIPAARASRHV